ncbi:hypothetical protein AAFP35_05335 [Gordonia sp. CPCC 206044]|uniref:hypothetical protein n=1 Tax=Gordonia sp. CPCC 206044 TaxID=3140793 RepID=UPI003AF35CD2
MTEIVAGLAAAAVVMTGCASGADRPEVGSMSPSARTTQSTAAQTPSGPSIGQQCPGADIGRTATDPNGTAIVCDNYVWAPDTGQTPRHRWADDQRAWTDCIATHSPAECRRILGVG